MSYFNNDNDEAENNSQPEDVSNEKEEALSPLKVEEQTRRVSKRKKVNEASNQVDFNALLIALPNYNAEKTIQENLENVELAKHLLNHYKFNTKTMKRLNKKYNKIQSLLNNVKKMIAKDDLLNAIHILYVIKTAADNNLTVLNMITALLEALDKEPWLINISDEYDDSDEWYKMF